MRRALVAKGKICLRGLSAGHGAQEADYGVASPMLCTHREITTVLQESGLLELLPAATIKAVKGLYSDESRHYHDFDHIAETLSWLNLALEDFSDKELAPYTSVELRLAALFHDVSYTTAGSPTNEQLSCEAFRALVQGMSKAAIDRVCKLIMITAEHGTLEAPDVPLAGRLMLDADIASLGQPRWEVFLYNNQNVIEELKLKYTPEQIAKSRRAFLGKLLEKESIYLSDWFRIRLEDQARRNLQRLLA